jgi:hypothetical protein
MDESLRKQIYDWIKSALAMKEVIESSGVILEDVSFNLNGEVVEANAIGCALVGKLGIKAALEIMKKANVTSGAAPLRVVVARELGIPNPEKFITFIDGFSDFTPSEVADLILEE